MPHSGLRYIVAAAGLALLAACHHQHAQVSRSVQGAFEAALAPSEDGFVAAWYDTRDGNAEIYVRLLAPDGRPLSDEKRLTNTPDDSFEASIDRLGDLLAVAWYEQTAGGRPAARLGAWTKDLVNRWTHTFASGTRNPVVRATSTAVFCAWVQAEGDSGEAVYAGWWDKDGRVTAPPVRLGPASRTTWNLNAAIDETGAGWVAFDAEVSTRTSEVYVAKLAGGTVTAAIRLTSDDGAPSKYPDVALGPGGLAALSWQEERDGNVEVYLFTGTTGDLNGEIDGRSRRVTNTPGESDGAYIAWNGDRLGLAWSDRSPGQPEVFFESFDRAGAPRAPAQRLTENSTWSLVPAIRPNGSGFALAWNEYRPASVGVHNGTSEVFFTTVP